MDKAPKQRESAVPTSRQLFGFSRRGFLALSANAAIGAIAAKAVFDGESREPESETPEPAPVVESPAPQEVEVQPTSEQFEALKARYRTQFTMSHREILFIDAQGHQVGETVPFEDFVVKRERTNDAGAVEQFDYLLTPGKLHENGVLLADNLAGEWIEHVKALHAKQHDVSPDSLKQQNVTEAFERAYENGEEALRDGIETAAIRSELDIVRHFADKEVRGALGQSRLEYLRENLTFTGNLAKVPTVTAELVRLVPGLCAVESKFNDSVTSSVGARGIFQFKPDTWVKELKRPPMEEGMPYVEQVKAAGELFSVMYDRLSYWCYEEENYGGRNYLEEVKQYFASQEDFERMFLTPCLINAYNTGEKGMGEVVRAFVETGQLNEVVKGTSGHAGFDLYLAMARFGAAEEGLGLHDYGPEASTYVEKIYAYAELLNKQSTQSEQVAMLE